MGYGSALSARLTRKAEGVVVWVTYEMGRGCECALFPIRTSAYVGAQEMACVEGSTHQCIDFRIPD
jgi:hypothetical protein